MQEEYVILQQDLPKVIPIILQDLKCEPLEVFSNEELVDLFKEEFKDRHFLEDNYKPAYSLDDLLLTDFLNTVCKKVLIKTLSGMVDEGLAKMVWDTEKNDFAFQISEKDEPNSKTIINNPENT